MPIAPVVGKDFKTVTSLRARIISEGAADSQNRTHFGLVFTDPPTFEYAFWRANGVCPGSGNFNLSADWPTDSPVRYQPIMPTSDGTWRVRPDLFVDLQQLKTEWAPQGALWAAEIGRDGSGNPTLTVVDLSA